VGDPLPPSLHIPVAVADLRAEQNTDRIEIRFTLPPLTTDNARVKRFQDVELVGGPEGSQGRIAVTASEPGPVDVAVPVSDWGGKPVMFRVRSQGVRGRWSEWSEPVTIAVAAPVAAPVVRAESTAGGVKLTWESVAGANYLIFRGAAGDATPVQIGSTAASEFLDREAQFDTAYSYRVQSTGSPLSAPVEITPKDTFPPAAPTGLSAIAGTGAVQLSWNPVEEADLAGYQVFRAEGEGAFIRVGGRLSAPSFGDRDARPGAAYRYRVTALDTAGNESPPSETAALSVP